MILEIKSEILHYKVGTDGVTEIVATDHGSDKQTIYKIKYGDAYTFIGMLHPHHVVRAI